MVVRHQRRKPLELPRASSPGKFEGEYRLSEFIWDLTLQGTTEGIGDVQDFGYYSMVDLGPDAVDDVAAQAKESSVVLTPDEREFIRTQAGAIVFEDNYGFVSVTYYDTKEELDREWQSIETDYERFMEGSDDGSGYLTEGDDPTMPGGGPPVYHGPEERWGG